MKNAGKAHHQAGPLFDTIHTKAVRTTAIPKNIGLVIIDRARVVFLAFQPFEEDIRCANPFRTTV
jgi:hypothetical protein